MLVVQSGAELPDRCIRCNAPAEGRRLRRQFYADAGALYLLLLLPTVFFARLATYLGQSTIVDVGLCRRHWEARRFAIVVCWLLALASAAGMFIGTRLDGHAWVFRIALIVFLLDLCFAARISRLLAVDQIDDKYAWFKNVNPAYLDDLPSR